MPVALQAPDRRPDGRWNARYETIDLWRALVAIGIVLHHAGHIDFGINTGRVVLFFVISGYCIAASAESCLRRGMSAADFFWRRARRIYPPYLLALLFWAGTRLVKLLQTGQNDLLVSPFHGLTRTAGDWVKNATLTQWLTTLHSPVTRPGDNPSLFVAAYWSLGYEEQFYLVISLMFGLAAVVPRARLRWMIPSLIPLALAYGLAFPQTIRGLFIEFWTAFAIGGLVYYRLSVFTERRWRAAIDIFLGIVVVLGITGIFIDQRLGDDVDRSKWHEWMIAGVFGLILIGIRPFDRLITGLRIVAPLRALGRITYSLFLVHQFNLVLISTVSARMIRVVQPSYLALEGGIAWYDLVLQVLLHIALATVFWLFCEYPFLNRGSSIDPREVVPSPRAEERGEAVTPVAVDPALSRGPAERGVAASRAG